MPFWGFRPIPAAVRAVPLQPGDRRLAWSLTVEGEPVLASAYGLTLPGQEFLDWHLVEKAIWQRPQLIVQVVSQPVGVAHAAVIVEGAGASCVLTLVPGGQLPGVVRARVTDSVVWSRHLRFDQGGVRVVGRRQPGGRGFAWQLVYDRGTDVEDSRMRAEADRALAAARQTVG